MLVFCEASVVDLFAVMKELPRLCVCGALKDIARRVVKTSFPRSGTHMFMSSYVHAFLLKMCPWTQIIYLQALPTAEWTDAEIEPILSQAYILSISFEGSPNHFS